MPTDYKNCGARSGGAVECVGEVEAPVILAN